MRNDGRMNPLTTVAAAAIGAAIGLVVQFWLSGRGNAPFVPPISLPVTLVFVAALLIGFGVRLRSTVTKRPGDVNPFHAVRLLATARAGQLAGALFGGFGGGLLLSLSGRSVPAPLETWLPMLLSLIAGAVLTVAGLVAEHLCKVPPGEDSDEGSGSDPSPGHAEGAAYRTPPTQDL